MHIIFSRFRSSLAGMRTRPRATGRGVGLVRQRFAAVAACGNLGRVGGRTFANQDIPACKRSFIGAPHLPIPTEQRLTSRAPLPSDLYPPWKTKMGARSVTSLPSTLSTDCLSVKAINGHKSNYVDQKGMSSSSSAASAWPLPLPFRPPRKRTVWATTSNEAPAVPSWRK